MNYEKEYKEAFKRAEKRFDPNPADGYAGYANGIIEDIFPQFIKREDERIRKTLIEELSACNTVGELKFRLPAPTREECIAWLEKQKEQKHPDGCFTCDEYKKGYEEGRRNGFTAGYNKAMKEVDEQKEPNYTKHNALFDECVKNCDPEVMKKVSDEIDKMLQKEQKPIVMHTPRYAPPEQKPAEWSEEDRLHYTNVLEALEYVKGCKSDYDKIEAVKSDIAWFKSLHPQPKQGWSEEDEEIFNNIIEKAKGGHWIEVNEITWLITRFKSLKPQPHWKPSEEQMKALLKVVDKARELHYSSNSGYDEYDVLRLLYEQLKKLM